MEIWDIYNKDREKQAGNFERSDKLLPEGQYHLVVHLCIFNNKGEMLIQHIVPNKSLAQLLICGT